MAAIFSVSIDESAANVRVKRTQEVVVGTSIYAGVTSHGPDVVWRYLVPVPLRRSWR